MGGCESEILGGSSGWVTGMGHCECSWCPEEVESMLTQGSMEGPRGRVQNVTNVCKV